MSEALQPVQESSLTPPRRLTHAELARRSAVRSNALLIRHHANRYTAAVAEELGPPPGKQGVVCPSCERPYRTDRAFRAMERAFDRAMGKPEIAALVVNLIGAEPERARVAVGVLEQVEHLGAEQAREMLIEQLRAEGYTVLPPGAAVNGESRTANGNGHSNASEGGASVLP